MTREGRRDHGIACRTETDDAVVFHAGTAHGLNGQVSSPAAVGLCVTALATVATREQRAPRARCGRRSSSRACSSAATSATGRSPAACRPAPRSCRVCSSGCSWACISRPDAVARIDGTPFLSDGWRRPPGGGAAGQRHHADPRGRRCSSAPAAAFAGAGWPAALGDAAPAELAGAPFEAMGSRWCSTRAIPMCRRCT